VSAGSLQPASAPAPIASRALPSGRALELTIGEGREELVVRAPSGEVEVRIAFGREGPVVTVRGGRLEVETPEEIALSCRSLEVRTKEALRLRSEGTAELRAGADVKVKAGGDVRMNGAFVRLNCDEEGANPPPPVPGETPVQALERMLAHARSVEAALGPDLGGRAGPEAILGALRALEHGRGHEHGPGCGHGHDDRKPEACSLNPDPARGSAPDSRQEEA